MVPNDFQLSYFIFTNNENTFCFWFVWKGKQRWKDKQKQHPISYGFHAWLNYMLHIIWARQSPPAQTIKQHLRCFPMFHRSCWSSLHHCAAHTHKWLYAHNHPKSSLSLQVILAPWCSSGSCSAATLPFLIDHRAPPHCQCEPQQIF